MQPITMRGRFAPTPSGQLHIGNARTALLAWLQIRQAGGEFVLRMEDLDRERSKLSLAEQALSVLRWLGLDWDEGPDVSGPYKPYDQASRFDLYEAALKKLMDQDRLYPCFCSRAELQAIANAPHGLASEGNAYPGTCRHLSEKERQARMLVKTPSLRFVMPDRAIKFDDSIAGPQTFAAGSGGDFVVKRADGLPSYQLAVIVDDDDMAITHVLRGDDLLDSTPRQLALAGALELHTPHYAHVPLLFGSDGKRLAKRHGHIALASLRGAGVQPERIVGWLAYWSGLIDRPEAVDAPSLIRGFAIARIPDQPVVVDEAHIRALLDTSR